MSMKFTRKGFFQSLFGGFIAAVTVPSITKAEQNISSETLTINPNGNVGIGESIGYTSNGNIGLGTNIPNCVLNVSSIIFHVNNRRLQMSGDDNGDFIIKWLDVEKDEMNNSITIHKPKVDPWKTKFNQIN